MSEKKEEQMPERMWESDQAAWFLNLTRQGLYEGVRRGLIPAARIGRRLRFDPATLREFVRNGGKA